MQNDFAPVLGLAFNSVGLTSSNEAVALISAICGAICAVTAIIRLVLHFLSGVKSGKRSRDIWADIHRMTGGDRGDKDVK